MSRATSLGKLATFQRRTTVVDGFGTSGDVFTTLGQAWVKIEPLTGREAIDARQVDATITHRITLRYGATLASLRPEDRMTWNATTYELVSVAVVDELNKWMECLAVEAA